MCLAHYGKNRSKLGPTPNEENVDIENYELYEEQRLINLSPDTVINVEDDAKNRVFEDLNTIDFAPNPINIKENFTNVVTRSQNHPILGPGKLSKITQNSFAAPTALVWNSAPNCIKEAKSCLIAKKLIRNYVKNLPL